MNMNKAINAVKDVFVKSQTSILEMHFKDRLEIQMEAYAELSDDNMEVLEAIADDAPYIDGHNASAGKTVNPYTHYAFFKRGNKISICPVHRHGVTCLNPLSVEDGVIELSRWSVGGNVTADRLADLVKEGYLVGYAIKL